MADTLPDDYELCTEEDDEGICGEVKFGLDPDGVPHHDTVECPKKQCDNDKCRCRLFGRGPKDPKYTYLADGGKYFPIDRTPKTGKYRNWEFKCFCTKHRSK